MVDLKRAINYLKNNVGKNIIVLIIFTLLGAIIFALLLVNQEARMMEKNALENARPFTDVSIDYEKVETDGMQNIELNITEEQIAEIMQLPEVLDVNVHTRIEVFTLKDDLQPYVPDLQALSYGTKLKSTNTSSSKPELEIDDEIVFDMNLVGQSKVEYASGSKGYHSDYEFTEMHNKEASQVAILNDKVMEINNLKIGDFITVEIDKEVFEIENEESLVEKELQIVGMYTYEPTSEELKKSAEFATDSEDLNLNFKGEYEKVIIPYSLALKLKSESESVLLNETGGTIEEVEYLGIDSGQNLTLKLDELESRESVIESIREITGEDYYTLLDETTEVLWSRALMKIFADLANNFTKIITVALVFILSAIITLNIKNRKIEIGILMSLGARKKSICIQVLFEQLIVANISMFLAYFIGSGLATWISNLNLAGETLEKIIIKPEIGLVLTLYIGGIVVVSIASIMPIIYLTKFNPKDILMD